MRIIKAPFEEFEEKEQWIIFLVSIIVAILTSIGSFSKLGSLLALTFGLVIGAVGYSTALLHRKLSILVTRINLQIRKADEDSRGIAEVLEDIIDLAKQDKMKKIVRKSLNGVKQILTAKGLEEGILRARVLEVLLRKRWKKVVSVSSYGLPGEWMDPYWFSYLCLQIGRAAELGVDKVIAKRFFIYPKKIVEQYKDELALLCESHSHYIKPFLHFAENVKDRLNSLGHKEVPVVDFTFIEYYDDCDKATKETIIWRNPCKNGEVEEATGSEAQLIRTLMGFLEQNENNLDTKGILAR